MGLVSILAKAGFTSHEIEAKVVAADIGQRPDNHITQLMDHVRSECATRIAEQRSRLSGDVWLTEMSLANNFDIVYGVNNNRIRIVMSAAGSNHGRWRPALFARSLCFAATEARRACGGVHDRRGRCNARDDRRGRGGRTLNVRDTNIGSVVNHEKKSYLIVIVISSSSYKFDKSFVFFNLILQLMMSCKDDSPM